MRKRWNKTGQSTLEYVIVLAAIMAAIAFFVSPSGGGAFSKTKDRGVGKMIYDAGNFMNAQGDRIINAFTPYDVNQ